MMAMTKWLLNQKNFKKMCAYGVDSNWNNEIEITLNYVTDNSFTFFNGFCIIVHV